MSTHSKCQEYAAPTSYLQHTMFTVHVIDNSHNDKLWLNGLDREKNKSAHITLQIFTVGNAPQLKAALSTVK